jgi:hypothetical protein
MYIVHKYPVPGQDSGCLAHSIGYVVKFEIKKDLAAQPVNPPDYFRAFTVKKLHTYFKDPDMVLKTGNQNFSFL